MNEKKSSPEWADKKYSFYSHKACEYYPCHTLPENEELNCLFCYCPLYCLGNKCGGNFSYTAEGFKDCSLCIVPHLKKNYGYITGKFSEIVKAMANDKK